MRHWELAVGNAGTAWRDYWSGGARRLGRERRDGRWEAAGLSEEGQSRHPEGVALR